MKIHLCCTNSIDFEIMIIFIKVTVFNYHLVSEVNPQLIFTYSNSTIETLEKGGRYVQS